MTFGRLLATAGGAVAILGMVTLSGPVAWAQDATPAAEAPLPPRPVHIHSGNCSQLGDVVQPLTDLTGGDGDRVGQARRAIAGESSYTSVPMTLDAILTGGHAINVHQSAEDIGTYIACGEIGGRLTANGALIIGLRQQSSSGYTGIAYLAPGADGASTDVSVFIAQTGRARAQAAGAGATPAADEETAGMEMTEPMASPDDAAMAGTPSAETGEDAMMMAGEQVPVSLTEFAIDMPATLSAGEVTFSVVNDGTITHSFEIEGGTLEEELETPLEPGQSGMLTVNLEPGTYRVYCPIGNHAQQGMELEVTVA
jgi:uncharacterized cupredoxin-like copper-binding protein